MGTRRMRKRYTAAHLVLASVIATVGGFGAGMHAAGIVLPVLDAAVRLVWVIAAAVIAVRVLLFIGHHVCDFMGGVIEGMREEHAATEEEVTR